MMSRNHLLRAIAASVICITMFGTSTTAAQGTVTVSGTVIDGRPGHACAPLSGTEVLLIDISEFSDVIDTTVSGEDGTYAFTGVPNKNLLVSIAADGVNETPIGMNITVAGSDLTGVNPLLAVMEEEGIPLFDPCTGLGPGTDPDDGGGTTDPDDGGGTTDPDDGGESPDTGNGAGQNSGSNGKVTNLPMTGSGSTHGSMNIAWMLAATVSVLCLGGGIAIRQKR